MQRRPAHRCTGTARRFGCQQWENKRWDDALVLSADEIKHYLTELYKLNFSACSSTWKSCWHLNKNTAKLVKSKIKHGQLLPKDWVKYKLQWEGKDVQLGLLERIRILRLKACVAFSLCQWPNTMREKTITQSPNQWDTITKSQENTKPHRSPWRSAGLQQQDKASPHLLHLGLCTWSQGSAAGVTTAYVL